MKCAKLLPSIGAVMSMLQIAICDDDRKDMDVIHDLVTKAMFDMEEVHVRQFQNGKEMISYLQEHPDGCDLLLLDICMQPVDGMETAEYIRGNRLDIDIIFITNSKDYVYKGYQYRAYAYINKSRMQEAVPKELRRYIKERMGSEAFLNVSVSGEIHRIPISSIRYIDSNGRKLTLHRKEGELSFYSKMSELEEELKKHGFLRIHQSYMVAKSEIRSFRADTVVLDDMELPVSRRYAEDVKKEYTGEVRNYRRSETVSVTRSFAMNSTDGGALIGIRGELAGKYYRFQPGEKLLIGKDDSKCQVVLRDNRVSRIHCEVELDLSKMKYILTDLSRNGVVVDGNVKLQKEEPTEVLPGTHLLIGSSENEMILG